MIATNGRRVISGPPRPVSITTSGIVQPSLLRKVSSSSSSTGWLNEEGYLVPTKNLGRVPVLDVEQLSKDEGAPRRSHIRRSICHSAKRVQNACKRHHASNALDLKKTAHTQSSRKSLTEYELSLNLAERKKQLKVPGYHKMYGSDLSTPDPRPKVLVGPSPQSNTKKTTSDTLPVMRPTQKRRPSSNEELAKQMVPCPDPVVHASILPSTSAAPRKDRSLFESPSSTTSRSPNLRSITLRLPRPPTDKTMINVFSKGETIFDTVEIPVVRKWVGPSDLHYAFLKCIPLAGGCLLLSVCFLAWGLCDILTTCLGGDGFTWDETGDLVVGIFKFSIGVAGLMAVVMKFRMGLHFLSVGFNVFLVSQCVSFITQWLEWGLAMAGVTTVDNVKWRPDTKEILYMIWSGLQLILTLGVSFLFIVGMLASLKMIAAVGGTGWERKTYLEILEAKTLIHHWEDDGLLESGQADSSNNMTSLYSNMALT
eukprot:Blabericola_migrator_1__4771@NODE_250_length_10882_cov_193_783819_g211_i0_p4_GENE_NODE_250_length_10882_cov_193_783819_g211_i0NODE_250_length_10882_cov_193_783819_g211_i0_p4_ORF_typecomplete_len496_score62_25_NODE_250_length_10882_cov_193_783819_g211_i0939410839